MAKDITSQLESLRLLNKSEFLALWLQAFGKPLQIPARRELLERCVAYRIQDRDQGGLSAATRKRLRRLTDEIAADPDTALRDIPCIKPGTRLIREWQGKTHKVTVTAEGFAYGGKRYKSLSKIARLITGTRWSGPRFFGLETSRNPTQGHSRAR